MIPTPNGGFFLQAAGTIAHQPTSFVARHDAAGDELWRVAFRGAAVSMSISDICTDGAGGVFLAADIIGAGFADPPLSGRDGALIRLDGSGNVIWARRIGGDGDENAKGLVEDGTGGLFCVGHSDSSAMMGNDPKGIIARIDAGCAFTWIDRSFDEHRLRGAARNGAGGMIAVGQNYVYDRGVLLRADGNGTVQWTMPLVTSGSFVAEWAVELLPDGTYLIAGFARIPGGSGQPTSRLIKRFDSAGGVVAEYVLDPAPVESSALYGLAIDGWGSGSVTGYVPAGGGVHDTWIARFALDPGGVPGCSGRPNSTGVSTRAQAVGSQLRADNAVTVYATDLPLNATGYFLASMTTGFVPNAGGSQGDLCLGGTIGRLNHAGEVQSSGVGDRFHLLLDLDDIPTPTGSTSVLAGQPWFFQAWHRDATLTSTSNSAGSVRVFLN